MQNITMTQIDKDAERLFMTLKSRFSRLGVSEEDATTAACLMGLVYTEIAHAYTSSNNPKEALGKAIAYCFSANFIDDLWDSLDSSASEIELN